MSVDVNFRAAVWLVCFLRYDAPWHIPPHARQFLPRACKRSCLRAGICLSLIVLQKNKKTAWNFPRKCSSKKQNRCIGGAGTKRWLPNHAGIRQREGRSRWAGVCVLITPLARTPQTALLSSCSRIDLLFAELRSRSWREGGSAQRSLALRGNAAVI